MWPFRQVTYQPVHDQDVEHSLGQKNKPRERETLLKQSQAPRLATILLVLTCAILIVSNSVLFLRLNRLQIALDDRGFTGVHSLGETWDQFRTYTEYSNIDTNVSDAAWAGFSTNGFVGIPHDEAAEAGLPLAEDFPDDPSKGVYVLSGFHQLHCVIYLRETIRDLREGRSVENRLVHINHCYDALRQEIQCRADDTPLYAPYKSKLTGDGQFRRCRDWSALTEWAKQRTACWPTGHCADMQRE